ncbi:MAG: competence/damage-inducible protein A [Acidimicrobiia bacterium]|nr:MAG: competence/damage-inducible protein A [Acidimicrobiia bacterium]
MRVETLAIGTELLLGQIVNSNAAEIAVRFADSGMTHHRQTVVGDNAYRMEEAIRESVTRCDALIITGGIGPTQDDITREVVAQVAGVALVFDSEYADALRDAWKRLGRDFPESNLRQAYRPDGADAIENPKGSAPGFRVEIDGCWVIALPGVPAEMTSMLDKQVMPFLRSLDGEGAGVVVSRVLRSWGMSEAGVGEMFDDIFHGSDNPTVAFLASAGVIKVRLTARADTEAEARSLIAPVEATVLERLGDYVFGFDDDTIEKIIHTTLLDKGWTIATAESATAGLVASRLTSVPGSSATFRGSIGAYAADIKTSLLDVPVALMRDKGIVSEDTALAMARGVRERLGADVGVAVTGSAGPSPLEVEAGTMCVAVVTPMGERSKTFKMPGDRERVRTYTATAALHQVRLALVQA